MKVFLVAISDSIHTARWIRQIADQDWDIYLYPSQTTNAIHHDINNIKICIPFALKASKYKLLNLLVKLINAIFLKIDPNYYAKRLSRYLKKIKPDIIHSLETQSAGYLVLEAKKNFFKKNEFPAWWHTNWGSDIYLFGKMPEHIGLIRSVMKESDYYSCECHRDVDLAIQFGLKGKVLNVYPNTGGLDLDVINRLRESCLKTSERKFIMLKGYQGWAGRALVGFRALERCKDILANFEVIVYSNTVAKDIQIAASLLQQATNIPVHLLPVTTSYINILSYHGKARISIGLSISDGISTSLLEAMAMGSFPIQSDTACAGEWITDNETGIMVHPEDPKQIELAIRKALADDQLVDKAALMNYAKIASDANFDKLKEITINTYKQIINSRYEQKF